MIRNISARTFSISRALIAMALVVTLLSAGATIAAERSPLPSSPVAAAAGLCPVDHVVAPALDAPDATPAPDATAAALLKGPPPSDDPPKPSWLEPSPSDMSLGGSWSKLPRSPFSAANAIALWAGDRMVAIDPDSGRTATYDPVIRRWEEHQPIPSTSDMSTLLFAGLPATAWTRDEVIFAGDRIEPDGESQVPVHLAFDPASGRWRTLAPSPLADTGELVWTGALLVDVTPDRHAAAYDPAADCWLPMPDVPLPELPANDRTMRAMDWSVDQSAWTGDGLLAVVHSEESEVGLGVVAFDPLSWTWDPGPLGPLASGSSAILVDDRLWFMDRSPNDRWLTNGTYDPGSESWTVLDTGCRLHAGFAVWTGRLIMEPLYARRAYDPASGACYRLPKRKDRARYVLDPVWTGREYVVWSGSWGDSGIGRPDGIVYRPPRSALTDAQAKPMSKKLKRAIEARQRYGFDSDPEVVRAIMRDPWQPASRKFGFPMTAAEENSIWSRSAKASQAGHVQPRLRKLPTYAGLWQDQRSGGDVAIALTEADPEVLSRIDGWMAGPWRLVIVPFTERELKRALWRVDKVSKRLDPDAILWAAGIDLSAGGLSLVYDPDDVGRMRAHEKELEQRIGVPVHISAGRVRDL